MNLLNHVVALVVIVLWPLCGFGQLGDVAAINVGG